MERKPAGLGHRFFTLGWSTGVAVHDSKGVCRTFDSLHAYSTSSLMMWEPSVGQSQLAARKLNRCCTAVAQRF